ncbi:putative methylcrotonoyl-CoA carboxylase beta chain, mitochondrial [Nymphon striatum]|nr:putative methylcrotonoyl-CoA carboxylase beta chain, mitochondrial [Nymphon striatum]
MSRVISRIESNHESFPKMQKNLRQRLIGNKEDSLHHLAGSDTWFMDRTLSSVPVLFERIFVIRAHLGETMGLQERLRNLCIDFRDGRKTLEQMLHGVIDGSIDKHCPEYQEAIERSNILENHLKNGLQKVNEGGGQRSFQRHTQVNNKILPKERVEALLDSKNDLFSLCNLAGFGMDYGDIPGAGYIMAIGKVHNRYCLICCNDSTVKSGASYPITVTKHLRAQHISQKNRIPCIYLVDSAGAFLPLQSEIFPSKEHGGRVFYNEAVLSADGIPQISVVCGSCTAGGAYVPTMSDEAVIVKKIGTVFLAGPPLVKAATGEIVSGEELGGADLHCRVSGCIDHYAENEINAYETCRDIVASLGVPNHATSKKYEEPVFNIDDLFILGGLKSIKRENIYQLLIYLCHDRENLLVAIFWGKESNGAT